MVWINLLKIILFCLSTLNHLQIAVCEVFYVVLMLKFTTETCEFVANNIAYLWRRHDLLAPNWGTVALAKQYPTSSHCGGEASNFFRQNKQGKKKEPSERMAKCQNDGCSDSACFIKVSESNTLTCWWNGVCSDVRTLPWIRSLLPLFKALKHLSRQYRRTQPRHSTMRIPIAANHPTTENSRSTE